MADLVRVRALTEREIVARLVAAVGRAGSIRAFAQSHHLSSGHVSEMLSGVRGVQESICQALGIERVVVWRDRERK